MVIIFLPSSSYPLKNMYVLTSFFSAHLNFHSRGKNKNNFIFHRTATIVFMRGYENEEGKPKLTPENKKKKTDTLEEKNSRIRGET